MKIKMQNQIEELRRSLSMFLENQKRGPWYHTFKKRKAIILEDGSQAWVDEDRQRWIQNSLAAMNHLASINESYANTIYPDSQKFLACEQKYFGWHEEFLPFLASLLVLAMCEEEFTTGRVQDLLAQSRKEMDKGPEATLTSFLDNPEIGLKVLLTTIWSRRFTQ